MERLAGLRPIMEAYELSVTQLSKISGVLKQTINWLRTEVEDNQETGPQLRTLNRLKQSLLCTLEDLTTIPTPARLAELRRLWFTRKAEQVPMVQGA